MRLNRDAQVNVLEGALPHLAPGARIVFVTSHQAHFIRTTPTMPEYEPVALSKRAGEDALRAKLPELEASGIEFVVVSGDMIEGTITATLLERANPGAIEARKQDAGRLYNVAEFAAEVASAAVEPVPADHTRYVGRHLGLRRRELTPASGARRGRSRGSRSGPASSSVPGDTRRRACCRAPAERERAHDLDDAEHDERDARDDEQQLRGPERREEQDDTGDDAEQAEEDRPALRRRVARVARARRCPRRSTGCRSARR